MYVVANEQKKYKIMVSKNASLLVISLSHSNPLSVGLLRQVECVQCVWCDVENVKVPVEYTETEALCM